MKPNVRLLGRRIVASEKSFRGLVVAHFLGDTIELGGLGKEKGHTLRITTKSFEGVTYAPRRIYPI
jgi:hypothetical protein